ncbi:hypothetical protein BD408DRAFT_445340 [Parasitella parasitica]|nr:hypothetical protein BD408DRAFT_445340 [Parasitella parasitica]
MDPYNQYGFQQPPPPQQGGYLPNPLPQRLPPNGPPMALSSATAPEVAGPPPRDAQKDKLNTLFVGAIAAGVSDEWIETLLKTCGNLVHWKRTKDPSGNPKGFGFATYDDPDSVLCALRVLGGEKTEGVTLKAQDGSGVEKKLIVKADDNVRTHLEGYQRQQLQQDEAKIVASDNEKYTLIQQYIHAITTGQQPSSGDAAESIDKELAFFKERAAERDHSHERRRDSSNDYQQAQRRRGDGFVKGPTEYHSQPPPVAAQHQQDMATDEEIEKRRKEKHDRDVENAFHQREKRFESREMHKLREYKKDMKRELELEEREMKDKAYWLERLANWDDDVEMAKGEEPYYHDRSRWRRMRESQRRREDERDEEDRRREIQEIQDEKVRLEEEERRKKDSRFLNRGADDAKIALKPTKLNFNMPIKRNTLGSADEDEDEEAKKKRRVLVPLDYGDIDQLNTDYDDEEPISSEERARRVKELIDSIPSSQEELWKYTVKWDELNENLIDTKLHPFVSKKIVDLLGMEEDDLVKFVLQFIRERKGPDELVSELEGALDEDAPVFVMKLWRALIFETERKYKRL